MAFPQPEHTQAWLSDTLRLFYIHINPSKPKGTILLIHGFPETSHQFRHVLTPLALANYRVIAPDYRGAGYSSKTASLTDYTKAFLARDLHTLITTHLDITSAIHIVGHDIGGMIAHAYVTQFPDGVESITWGECPLPGTAFYEENKHSPALWHFGFHAQTDMAVALVSGKEKMYLKDFYDRLAMDQAAFPGEVLDFYTAQYSAPGALRAAFSTYGMFEEDAAQNRKWTKEKGKVRVRCMGLVGEKVFMTARAEEMVREMYEDVEVHVVEGSGHYLAEENPEGFVKAVLRFVEKE